MAILCASFGLSSCHDFLSTYNYKGSCKNPIGPMKKSTDTCATRVFFYFRKNSNLLSMGGYDIFLHNALPIVSSTFDFLPTDICGYRGNSPSNRKYGLSILWQERS